MAIASAGAVGVLVYVVSWLTAGILTPGYHPVSQAISELFAHGAPAGPAWLLRGALIVTGLLLVPFAAVLDRRLPGRGRLGPVLAAASGVATVLIVAFPCTATCPGFGTTFTDSMHTVVAGTGYGALIAAPFAIAWRVRRSMPAFAAASVGLATLAAIGFAVHTAGIAPGYVGLEQRVFNTTADAWYVLAAGVIVSNRRRIPPRSTADGPPGEVDGPSAPADGGSAH